MTSASKVGQIFTQAGSAYSQLGDMIMRLHPAAQEVQAIEEKMVNINTDRILITRAKVIKLLFCKNVAL